MVVGRIAAPEGEGLSRGPSEAEKTGRGRLTPSQIPAPASYLYRPWLTVPFTSLADLKM